MASRHIRSLLPVCLLFSGSLLLSVPRLAVASSGPKYVALRSRRHYDRQLTYADVIANPANYVGRVFELRGRVGGMVETEEGVTIMLNLPDKSAPTLAIPRAEADPLKESMTPTVRVLVKVGDGASGNVAPLTVLALAHDSQVNAVEAQEAARAAALAKEAERRQRAERRTYRQYAARGGVSRALLNNADVRGLLAYYQPYLGPRVQPLFLPYLDFIARYNARLELPQAGQITYHLLRFADHYDVDPRLVVAMIIAESGFNPNATSRVGAAGLGQLMPGTARALGVNNPYDPVQNLNGSINYLRSRLNTFADRGGPGGSLTFDQVALALAAYNAGANAVQKYHGIPPYRETQAYVRRIMSLYQQLCGGN